MPDFILKLMDFMPITLLFWAAVPTKNDVLQVPRSRPSGAKMMNFVFKTRDFVSNTRRFVSKTRTFVLILMNFADTALAPRSRSD